MNSSSNLNLKNQPDTTDLEIGSFNEEEDQFMNKKQLVHIDDDTSINVDISDDDRSKSSTLKKSFLINNMSAFNEQFPINNQLANKKNENENDINDLTNSADFYNSQNGIGSYPLIMSDRNKEIFNKNKINNNMENNHFDINNINNNEMMQSLETKIDNNGYFFSKQNEQFNEENNINNLNYLTNKKINIKKKDINISIKDIDDDDEEEEEYEQNNNNIQMMLKKKMSPYSNIINENININNKNNINYQNEYIQNNNNQNINNNFINSSNNNNNRIPNYNNHQFNILQKSNFSLYILGMCPNKFSGSVNTSEQTFGLMQSKDFQNKYNQLESKYNTLLTQNKKLEENYEELKNSNKSVLDLLTYWQKFYLEILEIVKPKNQNKNDTSISDYMDDPYRIQVINDVKKIVLISRDKVYKNFYVSKNINLNFKGEEKKELNPKEDINKLNSNNKINNFNETNNFIQIESFTFKAKEKNIHKKYLNEEDDLNSLPPIRHKEKVNTGINTDITGEIFNKPIIKEVIKEIEVIKKIPLQIFDKKNLIICPKTQNISFINILPKKQDIKHNNNIENINKKEPLIKSKPISNSNINSNTKEVKPKFSGLKINSSIKLNFRGVAPKTPKKFKKNIMHKIAIVQTDMTSKNINSIETLNKACSSQLLNSQREKEKMQKLYEDKIASLNNYINENIKSVKKEKSTKNNKNKEKNYNDDNINNNNLIKNKENEMPPNLNSSFIFLPEMIPPENTYKIFMHCVKHFKYEEDIYKKYLEEEDLYTLKSFVEKMEKYLIGASLPVLKYNKKLKKEKEKSKEKNININNNYIKPENAINKRYKDNYIINHVRQKSSSSKLKISSNSENKVGDGESKINHIYNNNNTFNKYKAAIMALKDY